MQCLARVLTEQNCSNMSCVGGLKVASFEVRGHVVGGEDCSTLLYPLDKLYQTMY